MQTQDSPTSSPGSVDPAERAKFDQFASTWWNETGPMWPLHRLNKFRIGFISNVIYEQYQLKAADPDPLSGLRVLDIGCGGGILSETMARLGCEVTGVDISEKNIAVAKQHAADTALNISYSVDTAEALAERGLEFDIVLNMEVVEHVADLSVFMSACNHLVRADGLQFVSTINRNPLAWFIAIFGAETVLGWLPKGTHEYKKLVKPKELEQQLSEGSFTIVARTGVAVNPFNRQMSAKTSELVNYMVAATKAVH